MKPFQAFQICALIFALAQIFLGGETAMRFAYFLMTAWTAVIAMYYTVIALYWADKRCAEQEAQRQKDAA